MVGGCGMDSCDDRDSILCRWRIVLFPVMSELTSAYKFQTPFTVSKVIGT
jgi:hypothetical protein